MAIIETVRTKCRDCYKCVRACPVKAIKVTRGSAPYELHATVVEDFCIHDGTCLKECPQKAKKVRTDVPTVKRFFSRGERVAVSLAPSFAAALPIDEPLKIVTALRRLGVSIVQETALGAEMVAAAQRQLLQTDGRSMISSACPAIVSLVEKHFPEAREFLSPVVSPVIAHGRYLKRRYPGIRVVFIGPCVAKKDEISDPSVSDAVDVALTFQELMQWLDEAEIDPAQYPIGEFDPPYASYARLFPADGGLLRTCEQTEILSRSSVSVSGVENCREVIKHLLRRERLPQLVEAMACPGGCLSGPFALGEPDYYLKRDRLIRYAERSLKAFGEKKRAEDYAELLPLELLTRTYRDKKPKIVRPTQEQLKEILEKTGKFSPEDELNCGACGYQSCVEKAVAVFNGMADPEMCIPYMRQRAESMAHVVVGATPDGILVVSKDGIVIDMNQAAERILGLSKRNVIGLHVNRIMDAQFFNAAVGKDEVVRGELTLGDRYIEQQVLWVKDQKLLVGFLIDVTEERRVAEKQRGIREEAVKRAQRVIEKQMAVAQKIASLLGETTAETKVSLTELMKVIREEIPTPDGSKGGSGGSAVK
ncbi:MAG TPA: PAS domain S-box protein [Firmicutes bacterium]|nr:PAS domain S-box protein [Bacillota bacterium]